MSKIVYIVAYFSEQRSIFSGQNLNIKCNLFSRLCGLTAWGFVRIETRTCFYGLNKARENDFKQLIIDDYFIIENVFKLL